MARTRVTSAALFVALAFVVVGVLRADREIVRAERNRATTVVSETGTRVELFLLRHVASLETAVRSHDRLTARGSKQARFRDSVSRSTRPREFDALWVFDTEAPDSIAIVFDETDTSLDDRNTLAARVSVPQLLLPHIAARHREVGTRPFIVFDVRSDRLFFIEESLRDPAHLLIGEARVDSLNALLQRQRSAEFSNIVIRAGADTVLSIENRVQGTPAPVLQRPLDSPGNGDWILEMVYVPTGRGIRLALWIVGLGAIVGVGVGLLLERREAQRLAERSSELEHLSTELLRANRAKSEFLANVSHELRTPLNAIVGFVDLLRDGVYGPLNARQTGPVERIEASANHLRHLVDQVLDLAKMAAGRLEVHAEPVELRPFVFDVASEVEPLITEKGLTFSLAVGASLPRVRTDPIHLRQILINLLGNAVKFTNVGGVSVRGKLVGPDTRHNGPALTTPRTLPPSRPPKPDAIWIALQVADSGIGIPPKDRERIFEEFEQVNAGPRGDSMRRGTGLGLPISRRLARLLGGDLTVESELGRGSVFTVWLLVDPGEVQGSREA